jgi:hypothetical protein
VIHMHAVSAGASCTARIRGTLTRTWDEPASRGYLLLLGVCAVWAVTGGAGLGEESWRPRQAVVILTIPFFLVVHLLVAVTELDFAILGRSLYHETPARLFEPLFLLHVAVAGPLGARFIARWARRSRAAGRPAWVVPAWCALFFLAVLAVWSA